MSEPALIGSFRERLDDVPYSVATEPWEDLLGNHRARILVESEATAVRVRLPWRRRDAHPEAKHIIIRQAATGKAIDNVVRDAVTRECGDLIFQPDGVGEYHVYYLPYQTDLVAWASNINYGKDIGDYAPPVDTADLAWAARLPADRQAMPAARMLAFEARSELDRFDPMEVIATAAEVDELLACHPGPYLLFPEDRAHPLRMTADLPLRWVRSGPGTTFRGDAQRGEFYVFQIALYAARGPISDITVTFGDLYSVTGQAIAASSLRCFNTGGIDWTGRAFTKTVAVPQGGAQALWCGVQVPLDAVPGAYRGTVMVQPAGQEATTVELLLAVTSDCLADGGDSAPENLSRLRWLDSTAGIDDDVVAPYTSLEVDGQTVRCLGRQVQLAPTGFLDRITSGGRDVLAASLGFVVEGEEGPLAWTGGQPCFVKQAPGIVAWESRSTAGPLVMVCRAEMECDGFLNFLVTIRAEQTASVRDIYLEIPLCGEIATYMMGLGCKGGYRPREWRWVWDQTRANNTLWIGEVTAGLWCKLKGPHDVWDQFVLSSVPESWENGGKGGCTVTEESAAVVARAFSGARILQAGEEVEFRFELLITPIKPLTPDHWNQRYIHAYVPPERAAQVGANVMNIHHATDVNPYINYPFLTTEKLGAFVDEAHRQDVRVKIYYTVRELSTRVAELWALRSLGQEVFADGVAGGIPWTREHLVEHYSRAWHSAFSHTDIDIAIETTGLSRWHNYYIEGLGWLLRNVHIDGLYLDGIGYDRGIIKRLRKVMERERPGSLIDFHAGNEYALKYVFPDKRINTACKHMAHLAYIDSLWFGEFFHYDESPEYWLVEISGLPFGLFGEMLGSHEETNPWRGMLYGMTERYYGDERKNNPGPIWRLWDDFGIRDAHMLGYWDPACPVRTGRADILATAYYHPGRTLISLASWAAEPAACRLEFDWAALGMDPSRARLIAPAITGFQDFAAFQPDEPIPLAPARGWLLILEEI